MWVQRPAVSTEQSSEARTGGKGVRSGQVRRGERRRKTNRAPMRLMQRAMEERRQRESVRTQQEWSRLRRIREECEAAEEWACKRPNGCKPGGKFPPKGGSDKGRGGEDQQEAGGTRGDGRRGCDCGRRYS